MRELLPESGAPTGLPPVAAPKQHHGDFHMWAECYAVLAGVLASMFLGKPPQLMVYLRIISRASRNYDTYAWVEYDSAFRRCAGNCGSHGWGRPCITRCLQGEQGTLGNAPTVRSTHTRLMSSHTYPRYGPKFFHWRCVPSIQGDTMLFCSSSGERRSRITYN